MRIINLLQLRAAQSTQQRTKLIQHISKRTQKSTDKIHIRCCGSLKNETSEIVALEKASCVEDSSSQVRDVHAGKGVGLAEVTANAEEFGVDESGVQEVGDEVGQFVGVFLGAAVPVFWDAFGWEDCE